MFDFAFGKPCDHRTREEPVPVFVSFTTVKFNLTFQMDQQGPGFQLFINDADVTSTVTFLVTPGLDKEVNVVGTGYDVALYPPDDFVIEYTAPADRCPKCIRRMP